KIIRTVTVPDDGIFDGPVTSYFNYPRFAGDAAVTNNSALKVFELETGALRFAIPSLVADFDISPDGQTLGVVVWTDEGILESIATRLGFSWPFANNSKTTIRLHRMDDGEELGPWVIAGSAKPYIQWLPGQRAFATMDARDDRAWNIWDIP